MSAHDMEFVPAPYDTAAIVSDTLADLDGFSRFVERELLAVQLFGAITSKLVEQRPDQVTVTTDISSGKVGLEVAELTGSLPSRFTDPNTPIVQDVYYPPVNLPDGNHALLSEHIHWRNGIDSQVVARIPWLHILSGEVLTDFQNGDIDYLSDDALETYSQYDLDKTGRLENEPPFSNAHRLFFLHPLGQKATSSLVRERQDLVEHRRAYLACLETIASVVLPETHTM